MTANLLAISYDCTSATKTAEFWSRLLNRPVDDGASEDFATIGMTALSPSTIWMFHKVPEGKTAKNRVHVDLSSPSAEETVALALELGARHIGDFDEGGFRWTSLADPEGNEFDIVSV